MLLAVNKVTRIYMSLINTFGFCFVVTALAVLAVPVNAQSNGQFKVTVILQSANSTTGPCINGSKVSVSDAKVKTACATATGLVTDKESSEVDYSTLDIDSGVYRFIYLNTVDLLGAISGQTQMGTHNPVGSDTIWRLVHLPYLDYAEMQIGW
jgi:hypothetical protein